MAKMILTFVLMGILALGVIAPANFADAQNNKVNVLIGFHEIPDESLVKGMGGEIKKNFHPFINVIAANIPEAAINGLMKNPNVSFVEEDAIATIQGHSPSAGGEYESSWGVDHIDADVVHQIPHTGTGIKVAIIDTGVNYDHNDLNANYKGGIDIINNDNDPMDDHGHGSHVSGIFAAVANDAGVIGTASEAWIYGVKVLSSSGSGTYSDVISGIQWSSNNGMSVASLSLGGPESQALCDAVTAAYNNGVLVIAAAGNNGNPPGKGDNVVYPANCADAMAVAATNQDDKRASFSSTGPQIEISAPGVSIYSTHLGQNYATFSGTSMATPHVSGVAALVFASGGYTNENVRTILQQTANDLGPSGRDSKYGFGLVDPVEAVGADSGSGDTTDPVNDAPTVSITSPADGSTFDSGATILFEGTASDTEDGDLTASLSWTSSIEGPIGTGGSFSTTLSDGTHTITAQVTDSGGVTANSSISITVGNPPAEATTVSVSSITYATEGGKNKDKHLLITVALVDDLGNPVSGASVSIDLFRDSFVGSGTGTTGTDGTVTWTLKNAASGCYTTTVTDVTAEGLTWDSATPANEFCK